MGAKSETHTHVDSTPGDARGCAPGERSFAAPSWESTFGLAQLIYINDPKKSDDVFTKGWNGSISP
jgi:hypothetical protein